MTPDDIAVCAIRNGSVLNGEKPTVEINFHAGILRARV
jgi:ribulose-5-phosphate 4-epimerase/fuculose-1-phosphate aldolase